MKLVIGLSVYIILSALLIAIGVEAVEEFNDETSDPD